MEFEDSPLHSMDEWIVLEALLTNQTHIEPYLPSRNSTLIPDCGPALDRAHSFIMFILNPEADFII